MDLGIAGRWALVCGASKGLGYGCARALAGEGVNLVINARTASALAAAADRIRGETGVQVVAVACDITTPQGRAESLAACPQVDILINNAGGPPPGDFRNWTREHWIAALDANMLTPIELIKATVDGMIARRFGRILNIVSRSVKIPQHELGLSNGARSGLVGFTSGLARQTVQHNVTINNLLPGLFATDAQRRHVASLVSADGPGFDALWQSREAAVPARRFGDPAEFGAYAAFLCSAHAGYITAQNLLIDGGSYPATY